MLETRQLSFTDKLSNMIILYTPIFNFAKIKHKKYLYFLCITHLFHSHIYFSNFNIHNKSPKYDIFIYKNKYIRIQQTKILKLICY